MSEPGPDRRLPPRPPRSFSVHWLVDAAVAFVAVAFLALLLGIPLVPLALVAMGVGLVAAPFTRRAEIRALAARADGADGSPGPGDPTP